MSFLNKTIKVLDDAIGMIFENLETTENVISLAEKSSIEFLLRYEVNRKRKCSIENIENYYTELPKNEIPQEVQLVLQKRKNLKEKKLKLKLFLSLKKRYLENEFREFVKQSFFKIGFRCSLNRNYNILKDIFMEDKRNEILEIKRKLSILSAIPDSTKPQEFADLFPIITKDAKYENYIVGSNKKKDHLDIISWYIKKAKRIEFNTGFLDQSLNFLNIAIELNKDGLSEEEFPEIFKLRNDLMILNTAIYEFGFEGLYLSDFEALSNTEKFKFLLGNEKVSRKNVRKIYDSIATKFLKALKKEEQIEILKIFFTNISKNNLEICSQIVDKIGDPSLMLEITINCLYNSSEPRIKDLEMMFDKISTIILKNTCEKYPNFHIEDLRSQIDVLEIIFSYNISQNIESIKNLNINELKLLVKKLVNQTNQMQNRAKFKELYNDLIELQDNRWIKKILLGEQKELEQFPSFVTFTFLKACFLNGEMSLASEIIIMNDLNILKTQESLYEITQELVNSIFSTQDSSIKLARKCFQFYKEVIEKKIETSDNLEEIKKKWKFEVDLMDSMVLMSSQFNKIKLPMQIRLENDKLKIIKFLINENKNSKHPESLGILKNILFLISDDIFEKPEQLIQKMIAEACFNTFKDFKATKHIIKELIAEDFEDAYYLAYELASFFSKKRDPFDSMEERKEFLNFSIRHCKKNSELEQILDTWKNFEIKNSVSKFNEKIGNSDSEFLKYEDNFSDLLENLDQVFFEVLQNEKNSETQSVGKVKHLLMIESRINAIEEKSLGSEKLVYLAKSSLVSSLQNESQDIGNFADFFYYLLSIDKNFIAQSSINLFQSLLFKNSNSSIKVIENLLFLSTYFYSLYSSIVFKIFANPFSVPPKELVPKVITNISQDENQKKLKKLGLEGIFKALLTHKKFEETLKDIKEINSFFRGNTVTNFYQFLKDKEYKKKLLLDTLKKMEITIDNQNEEGFKFISKLVKKYGIKELEFIVVYLTKLMTSKNTSGKTERSKENQIIMKQFEKLLTREMIDLNPAYIHDSLVNDIITKIDPKDLEMLQFIYLIVLELEANYANNLGNSGTFNPYTTLTTTQKKLSILSSFISVLKIDYGLDLNLIMIAISSEIRIFNVVKNFINFENLKKFISVVSECQLCDSHGFLNLFIVDQLEKDEITIEQTELISSLVKDYSHTKLFAFFLLLSNVYEKGLSMGKTKPMLMLYKIIFSNLSKEKKTVFSEQELENFEKLKYQMFILELKLHPIVKEEGVFEIFASYLILEKRILTFKTFFICLLLKTENIFIVHKLFLKVSEIFTKYFSISQKSKYVDPITEKTRKIYLEALQDLLNCINIYVPEKSTTEEETDEEETDEENDEDSDEDDFEDFLGDENMISIVNCEVLVWPPENHSDSLTYFRKFLKSINLQELKNIENDEKWNDFKKTEFEDIIEKAKKQFTTYTEQKDTKVEAKLEVLKQLEKYGSSITFNNNDKKVGLIDSTILYVTETSKLIQNNFGDQEDVTKILKGENENRKFIHINLTPIGENEEQWKSQFLVLLESSSSKSQLNSLVMTIKLWDDCRENINEESDYISVLKICFLETLKKMISQQEFETLLKICKEFRQKKFYFSEEDERELISKAIKLNKLVAIKLSLQSKRKETKEKGIQLVKSNIGYLLDPKVITKQELGKLLSSIILGNCNFLLDDSTNGNLLKEVLMDGRIELDSEIKELIIPELCLVSKNILFAADYLVNSLLKTPMLLRFWKTNFFQLRLFLEDNIKFLEAENKEENQTELKLFSKALENIKEL